MHAEPGSFRDRHSRVFYDNGDVVRLLDDEGLEDWNALAASSLYARFTEQRHLVASEFLDQHPSIQNGWSGLLRHERIPFVSYPYEWTFSMLKDAALLELDLILAGLDEGLILKDGTPYNVQWRGAAPVFIDVGSFERLNDGEPWAGYRQFCMQFLYPLMLQSYRAVPFQPWLRGSLEGIEPRDCRRLFSMRDLFRPGVLTHVVMHQRLERRHGSSGGDTTQELREAGFRGEMIKANVRRIRRLVDRLEARNAESAWTEYGVDNTYSDKEAARKSEAVRATARVVRPSLVWDIGANDGRYSRIAAEHADYVLALDSDERTVDRLYVQLAAEECDSILPLVMDAVDPSPALGWRNLERKTLIDRGRPELVLCLALAHHLTITRNVPLSSFLGWLRTFESALLVEFPSPDDPMVRRLLDAKRASSHDDYTRMNFERLLRESFVVDEIIELTPTRTLYRASPRT